MAYFIIFNPENYFRINLSIAIMIFVFAFVLAIIFYTFISIIFTKRIDNAIIVFAAS